MASPTVAATQTAAYLAGVAFDDGYNSGGGTTNDRPVYYHGDQIGTTRRMTGTDASVAGPGTNGGGGPDPTPPTLARSTFTAFGEPIERVQMGDPGRAAQGSQDPGGWIANTHDRSRGDERLNDLNRGSLIPSAARWTWPRVGVCRSETASHARRERG